MSNTVNNYTETDLGNISLNPRGEYDSSVEYEYLDAVSYQGGSYFCLAELETTITGIAPDAGRNSEHWQMIAAPGDMTPEYTAAYNNVINKAVQVEESRAAVELAQQEIEAVQTDVQQLHSDTVQTAQEAENSKNSAADSAQSAEQSRKTASESERNINGQIAGFDSRVSEAVEQSKEEINTTKQQAINTITKQQTTSVNTVKTEGEKIITRVGNDAKTVADDRATVEEATQTVLNNAQEVARNAQIVAGNTENAAASAESAKTSADNAAQSAKGVEDASKQIEQNKKDVDSLKEDIVGLNKVTKSNKNYIQQISTGVNSEITNTKIIFRGVDKNINEQGYAILKKESGVSTNQIIMGVYWEYDFTTWEELPEIVYFDVKTITAQSGGTLSMYLLPSAGDYGTNAGQWDLSTGSIKLRKRCEGSSIASTLLKNGKVYILFGITQFDANKRTEMSFEYAICFWTENEYVCVATDFREDKIQDLKKKLDAASKSSLEIVGYGDSLTANGGWTTVIAEKSGLEFHNAGTGGESVNTIIARQGADPMIVNDIIIPADTTPVIVGKMSEGGITTASGVVATPLLQGGSAHVNPCYIGDTEGRLKWTGSAWNDQTGTWTFIRTSKGTAVKIDRPTKIKTAYDAIYNNKKNILLTVFMGYNGWKNANGDWWQLDDLLKYHKMLISNTECKDFVVIGIHKARGTFDMNVYEEMFENEFGRRFISLRQYLAHPIYADDGFTIISSYGLMDAGLDATDTDLSDIRAGNCPSSLLFDGVHFNNYGKAVVGNYIYSRMKELNMFGGNADATIQYIEKYNETDPTVPSWAKEPTKPTYTANEVGAFPVGLTKDEYIANKLTAGNNRYGLVKFENSAGIMILGDTGRMIIQRASQEDINTHHQNYNPIVPSNLDYAVKCAMSDGKGAEWTDEERINALLRMGCTVDENGFVKWTASETTE